MFSQSPLVRKIEENNKAFKKALEANDRNRYTIAQENVKLISELIKFAESQGLSKNEIRERLSSLKH